ncbi:MoaD/ThiS family protein [Acetobacterium sp. K1/6]|uniref:MoaD/ThiS family protein n=1 Tax=Acetobacterium sp. K1/6 TaxID=3055467 RepID=UPI002ACA628F|nr:MoaD/ThiS family protein [Acetobacterium sp. K1/6]MDZ5726184.1 MoaD/ThiS family protein [Acetobacterium sp. K1/6]
MKILVLPPGRYTSEKMDENGYLDIKEHSTVGDVLKILKMPKIIAKIWLTSVNGQIVPFNTALKDGDTIGFFSGLSGG